MAYDFEQDQVFRRIDENHKKQMNIDTQRLIKNSVAPKDKRRKVIEKWKPSMKSVMAITLVTTMLIAILVNMLQNKIEEKEIVDAAIEYGMDQTEIDEITKGAEKTYRNPGLVDYAVDHETYDIADYLVNKSDDFHRDLFLAYKMIDSTSEYAGADTKRVMDEILQRVSAMNDENNPNNVLDYNSFDDYQERHVFVDKDGKPSTKAYEEGMTEKIVSEYQAETFDTEHGTRGGR